MRQSGDTELLAGIIETYPNLQPDKADIRIDERAAKGYEGAGMGLAIVRKVVEPMDGRLGSNRGKAAAAASGLTFPWLPAPQWGRLICPLSALPANLWTFCACQEMLLFD